MRRLFLETNLSFYDRFPRNVKPAKVWFDGDYQYIEMACGCGNRTTKGGGDGITELCLDHALPEPAEEESRD